MRKMLGNDEIETEKSRVVWGSSYAVGDLTNLTKQNEFVDSLITQNEESYTDGVNIDFESPVQAKSVESAMLTLLMKVLYYFN